MASLDFEGEKVAFRDFYRENYDWLRAAEDSLRTVLALLLSDRDEFQTPVVTSRVKDCEESVKKFGRKYQRELEAAGTEYEIRPFITDLLGLRITCLYEDEVAKIQECLSQEFEVIEVTDRAASMEDSETLFGYKGLHLDLKLSETRRDLPEYRGFRDLQFEVQIRTAVQDAWATVDHKIKYKRNIPNPLKRRINRLAALFELADQEFENIRDETFDYERRATTDEPLPTDSQPATSPLSPFKFLRVAQETFGSYKFLAYKVDGFVSELSELDPPVTEDSLKQALHENQELLNKYRDYQWTRFRNRLNPFTQVRHVVYLSNPEKYSSVLYDLQRHTFDDWLKDEGGGAGQQATTG